jgi:SAM-dependent methyltransferase
MKQILAHSSAYRFYHLLLGTKRLRNWYINKIVEPFDGCIIIDLGCGPADFLDSLPNVRYIGVDVNPRYIEDAKRRFAGRGEFHIAPISSVRSLNLPEADIVMANGVVHHLNDAGARQLFEIARICLKPGGRAVTFDPYLCENQNAISRWLITNDRGLYVRSETGYVTLAHEFFTNVEILRTRSLLRVPYDVIMLKCQNKVGSPPSSER